MNFFSVIILLLFVQVLSFASFLTDASNLSYSVRAMGRGGAQISEPYGADSLTSNPAGLSQGGSGLQVNNLDYSNVNSQFKQATLFHRQSIGIGLWKVEANSNSLETFAVGYSRRNRNGVDWGLTYKSLNYNTLSQQKTLWSSDLGLIIHMNQGLDIGFVGKDVLGSEDREFKPSFETGVLLKNKNASVKIFSDLVFDTEPSDYADSYVRYGLDYELTQDFTFRVGGDQHYYTSGVSFDLPILSVDYAYKSPKDQSREAIYALGLKFGRARQPDAFRRKYALFKPHSIAYLEINGALTGGYSSISLLGGRKIGSNDLLRLINEANNDNDCQGYLIRIKSLDSGLYNIAMVQEIRDELVKAKQLGKKIYVYLDGWAPMSSYYLASVGDVIVMPPMGSIHELGIQFEVLKFEDLMNKFGVKFNSVISGKYKVSNSPTTSKMRLSQKETIRGSLENVMAQLKSDIHFSRKTSFSNEIYDGRIISAQKAQDMGLIDHIGFWQDMRTFLKKDLKGKSDVVLTSLAVYDDDASGDLLWSPFNKIAVIEINGVITSGRNRSDFLFGGVQTGSDEIAAIFNKLSRDPFLKGVVIRVNSPGGSILAADQILNAINQFKAVSNKPVFTSMGTLAASGGYYVALGSDQIFANPSSITGSIGVVSGFFNFYDFEKEWGISSESLSTGKYMDTFSPHQQFSNDKKAMLAAWQQTAYHHFRSLVQDSRQLTDDEVNSVAQGQFMTGNEAKGLGLVDEVGSYQDTIDAMEKTVGLTNSRVVVYGRPSQRSPFDFLKFLFD